MGTIWLLGDEGHLVTNHHVTHDPVTGENRTKQMVIYMKGESKNCTENCLDNIGTGSNKACQYEILHQPGQGDGLKLIQTGDDANYDYSLVELPSVNKNKASAYGYLQLRTYGPVIGERIYISQYPAPTDFGIFGKRIAYKSTHSNDNGFPLLVNGDNSQRIGYYADTYGGSSGSPVISYGSNCVVALHEYGGCPNQGLRSNELINELISQGNLPNNSTVTCCLETFSVDITGTIPDNCDLNNGSVTADPSGGAPPYNSYHWSNGATTQTINNLIPGLYSVTVTDDMGCTKEESHSIEVSDIQITTDHEYDTDQLITSNIIVKTGAELTVSAKLEFVNEKGIIVERGAKLIVDGGTLTKCPNADSWEGIYVEGVHDAVQPNFDDMPTSGQAGIVWTKNGAKIEYATVGIRTMKYGQSWNEPYWGGVVYCTNTEFLNCRKSVEFMKYGFPTNFSNKSAFRYCTFTTDGNYTFSGVPEGITIWNCDDIRIQRSNFINLYYGLSGIDFSSIVTDANLFKDCKYAVKSRAANPFSAAMVIGEDATDPNIFHNNARSIWMQANDYLNGAEIENNDIYVSSTYSFPLSKHNGLYLEGPNYFRVQENNFTDYFSAAVISHTGIDRNYFRCNTIGNDEDMDAEGLVIRNRNDYLKFLSNTFVIPFDCKPDVRIYGSQYLGTVNPYQGRINGPADNCFTKQGRLEVEALYNTRYFDYYVEYNYTDPCVLPTDNLSDGGVNNYGLEFTQMFEVNCEAQTGPGGEVTVSGSNVTMEGGGSESGDGDYDTLRYQINTEWNAGNYQNAIQILLNDGSPHAMRIAFGMYIKLGNYVSADSLLNIILANNAMDDTPEFYAVQTINLKRLNAIGDTTGFVLTQAEYDTLYSIGQGETYSATYAKSLLDFLEGVIIDFIPNPDCIENAEQISDKGAGLREWDNNIELNDLSVKIWPTPVADLLNYEILNLGSRTLQSIRLTYSNGKLIDIKRSSEGANINISSLSSGLYIVEFHFDDGRSITKRFIKS